MTPDRRTQSNHKTLRRLGFGAAIATIVVFASGCVPNAKQDSLKPKSHYADTIYNLIVPIFIVGGIISVIVLGATGWFMFKYRARTDDPDAVEAPEQIHGNAAFELGWTITPAVILLFVGFFTVVTVFKLAKEPPAKNPHVQVIGQQWWWEFRYDLGGAGTKESQRKYNDIVTANDLVIPAGVDVSLRMDARDVLHGFWAPELQGKRDVVPGRTTMFNIAARDPGTYYGQCTVMCGLSHANMRFVVIALPPAEYKEWIAHQVKPAVMPSAGLAKDGAELFESQCGMCHYVRGVMANDPSGAKSNPLAAKAAPDLTHLMTRTTFASGTYDLRIKSKRCIAKGWKFAEDPSCINTAAMRAWLHDPEAMLPMAPHGINDEPGTIRGMPNLGLSPGAIDQLVAFLETLK